MASTQPCGQYVSLQTTDVTAWTWFSSSTELLRCREQRSLRKTLAYVQAGNTALAHMINGVANQKPRIIAATSAGHAWKATRTGIGASRSSMKSSIT
jgi:hypothetical protein